MVYDATSSHTLARLAWSINKSPFPWLGGAKGSIDGERQLETAECKKSFISDGNRLFDGTNGELGCLGLCVMVWGAGCSLLIEHGCLALIFGECFRLLLQCSAVKTARKCQRASTERSEDTLLYAYKSPDIRLRFCRERMRCDGGICHRMALFSRRVVISRFSRR